MNDNILLESDDVANMLRLGRKSFYKFLKSDASVGFPAPINFGRRLNRWRRDDIVNWVNGQKADATSEE